MTHTPSGVELFNTPARDEWSDLFLMLVMFGIAMVLILVFCCGFGAGVLWTRCTTRARPTLGEPETEPVPARVIADVTTTGTSTKPTKQKKTRNVCCQAQTRYNLDLQTPRFQPLPEYAHGAFLE